MYIKCYSSAIIGIDAIVITVEVDNSKGFKYYIVGLPDDAIKESQKRIEAAFNNNGFRMPNNKITVNLAPANVKKEGSYFDLPIAIAILAASEQINFIDVDKYMILGELSLNGMVQPIHGALSMAIEAKRAGFEGIILPNENASEASVVEGLKVYGVNNILEVTSFFNKESELIAATPEPFENIIEHQSDLTNIDFSDVRGQNNVKRALEIAAAGGHNVLMIGSPGSGKSMLAKRICSILPKMTLEESLETTKIHSVAGAKSQGGLIKTRPFRAPHHTVSSIAIVGGGSNPKPGEISLANNGILFLDELPEFGRGVLEVMRQPLEERNITISRSKYSVNYPSNFMLVSAMNPCPCGYLNHPEKECNCTSGDIRRYKNRISGPLLDRIDIHIEVMPVPLRELTEKGTGEQSSIIRERVSKARNIQTERFRDSDIFSNAMMSSKQTEKYCHLDDENKKILSTIITKMSLSARSYSKILKLSRTIADLDNSPDITISHLMEAIQVRGGSSSGTIIST